jgi:hypothetical protein
MKNTKITFCKKVYLVCFHLRRIKDRKIAIFIGNLKYKKREIFFLYRI